MNVHFLGAARCVTGSCYMIECEKGRILVDCGMRQGSDEDAMPKGEFPFAPGEIDAVLLTHAHIDHSGLLPLLFKQGFKGNIICTGATAELCSVMLPDSGHIQEMEAEWTNLKRKRAGLEPVVPLYTAQDARDCIERFSWADYHSPVQVLPNARAVFYDMGHLLGSAAVELCIKDKGKEQKLVFSGDIGRPGRPMLKNPEPIFDADALIMEGTYGDRLHEPESDKIDILANIIQDTFKRGGNVVIPSFSVGRTQEMLFYLEEMMRCGRFPALTNVPVYIDSPLGIEATKIYERNARKYFNQDAVTLLHKGVDMFTFPSLVVARTPDESKAINDIQAPKVIISSSGMCEAGRIKHHLKHNLWRGESTILFVGYQAIGTLGRSVLDGAQKVTIFGDEVQVKARIERMEGFSGHADRDELMEWLGHFKTPPQKLFLVHGEEPVLKSLRAHIRANMDIEAVIPRLYNSFDLSLMRPGVFLQPQVSAAPPLKSAIAFDELYEQAARVMSLLQFAERVESDPSMAVRMEILDSDLRMFVQKWESIFKPSEVY